MSKFEAREYDLEFQGQSLRVVSVDIDGQRLSDTFGLFHASMKEITSSVCEECYSATGGMSPSCSHADIHARRHGESVYWFAAKDGFASPLLANTPLSDVWSFPRLEYEEQLRGNASSLPEFSDADARLILGRATIYPYQLGLYVTPELDDDPQGWGLLKSIDQILKSNDITISSAPERSATIEIGIEADGIPEVKFEVGICKGHGAVRFDSNPYFPRWVTSATIHEFAQQLVTDQSPNMHDDMSV